MSRYRRVDTRTWNDEKFRSLTQAGRFLWLYLLTSPQTTAVPGLIALGRAQLAEELEWTQRKVDAAFSELQRLGMAQADWTARLVWLPRAAEHNQPESPSVVKAWAAQLRELPECELRSQAHSQLDAFLIATRAPAWVAAFRAATANPSSPGRQTPKVRNARVFQRRGAERFFSNSDTTSAQKEVGEVTEKRSKPPQSHNSRRQPEGQADVSLNGRLTAACAGPGVHQDQDQEKRSEISSARAVSLSSVDTSADNDNSPRPVTTEALKETKPATRNDNGVRGPLRLSQMDALMSGAADVSALVFQRFQQQALWLTERFALEPWRSEWEAIARKPRAETDRVLQVLQTSVWAAQNRGSCSPRHLLRHWASYAAGEEPGGAKWQKPTESPSASRAPRGMAPVASREQYDRDAEQTRRWLSDGQGVDGEDS